MFSWAEPQRAECTTVADRGSSRQSGVKAYHPHLNKRLLRALVIGVPILSTLSEVHRSSAIFEEFS